MKKRLYLAAAGAAAFLGSYAQINSPSSDGYLMRAADMYADGNYNGCLDQLTAVDAATLSPQQLQQMQYYYAAAMVHSDKDAAADLLQRFLQQHPASSLYNLALMAYADCYYGSDYAKALDIYQKVDYDDLTPDQADELYYRMAYSCMKLQKYDKAQRYLLNLADSPQYAEAAKFYRGYIAYAKEDYSDAEAILKEVNTSKAPGNMAEFYLSEIYYRNGDKTRALSMAKNILGRSDIAPQFVAEANRIAGEAEYEAGHDSQAVRYLNTYVEMTEHPMPSALYILGLNAYNKGEYNKAIECMRVATEKSDAMGQSAYLYMGQAYMHLNDYSAAAMAFNRALNMQYDSSVQETAYYNYAVASMKGGKVPFANTVEIFSNFLKLYPNSKYAPAVQEYIINSYITDNNYASALKSINEMKKPSEATLAAKQRVLYALGVKSLASANYKQALTYLNEARQLKKYSSDIDREVSLALGEALYLSGDYAKSETEVAKYLNSSGKNKDNYAIALYDMGYALYGQKKYSQAAEYFNKLLSDPNKLTTNVSSDAWNRLGDCYYYQTDFNNAAVAYDNAYRENPNAGDYALFQKALMAGYQRQYNQKLNILKDLQDKFPKSALIPDALLETTECYIQLANPNKAIEVYKQLVKKYPNTAQGRQGYLQMALVMLNSGDHDAAVNAYKEVIRRYPSSEEAVQAVEQMKRICAADGTLKDFMAFLGSVNGAPQINESDIEQLTFENAEKEYLTNDKLDKLEDFIDDYPESNMRPKALSYLYEGEMERGDQQAAYEYAVALINQYPDNSLVQGALVTKATIEESRGKGADAMATWKKLAQVASSPAMLLNARMGIIRNAREAALWDEVTEAADAVLATSGVGTDDITEAAFSKGLALYRKGNLKEARKAWESVAKNTDNLYGVQSAYYLAESYFNAKDYKTAETWANIVSNADSAHQYWIARGFILLSDIYSAQGDKYKARQYLEAVRDYYTGTEEDIFQMINKRL